MTAPIPRDIPDLPAVPGMITLLPSHVPATAVVTPARRPLTAAYRLLVALAAATAVALELHLGSPARILSYFAIQTNILLALTFTLSARRAWTARHPLPSTLTGATLLYTVITALAHHVLLAHTTPPFSMTGQPVEPWGAHWIATQLLNTATPLAALLDWLLLTTPSGLHLRQVPTWLVYPLAYLTFTLARGAALSPTAPARYLYPYLDAARHGYRQILGNALLLTLAVVALAALLIAADHARPNPNHHRPKTGFRLRPPVG